MAIKTSIVSRNAELDALAPLFNAGTLKIYSGTQPATPETAASGVLLATLTFGNPAFGASINGVITANAITSDSSADATNTAGWARAWKSDGTTALMDGDVSTSGAWVNLNTTAISSGAIVAITALTITNPT
jgi:hypothetical protein